MPLFVSLLFLLAALSLGLEQSGSAVERRDGKRDLARKLIRRADGYKESSLRDVLQDKDHVDHDEFQERGSENLLRSAKYSVGRPSVRRMRQRPYSRGIPTTLSGLFAWAIDATVYAKTRAAAWKATPPRTEKYRQADDAKVAQAEKKARLKLAAAAHMSRTTESRVRRTTESFSKSKDRTAFGAHMNADTEAALLQRGLKVLDEPQATPSRRVAALLTLEELCHSADNGRDLEKSGGVKSVVNALRSTHDGVRASAAWALATCSQNNPSVQNASLVLHAVPMLASLAAHDSSSVVRSRALFALNAVLELPAARVKFEETGSAVHAVRRALIENTDRRATRRALNLAELLVAKNLELWKVLLEAWDIPPVIERLMRVHHDIDVRESAARVIAALDGRSAA